MRFLSPSSQLLLQVVPHLDYATNTIFHFLPKSLWTNPPVIWCYVIQIIENLLVQLVPHLDYATNTSFHFLSKSLFTVIWCYIIQIIESITN